jgi:hypothetical protein
VAAGCSQRCPLPLQPLYTTPITPLCTIIGDTTAFPVTINDDQYVCELKEEIKKGNPQTLANVEAEDLRLYRVKIDVSNDEAYYQEALAISESSMHWTRVELTPSLKLSRYFQESGPPEKAIPKETIHVLVQLPRRESIGPTAWS